MNVILYSISKKLNSTQQPDNSTPKITFSDVVLKDDCSITHPILIIRFTTGNVNLSSYNYCYIALFSRYYYITDCIFVRNGVAEIHCKCVVLATYKNSIGATTCYILRSATHFDYTLPDSKFPATGEITVSNSEPVQMNSLSPAFTNGTPWSMTYNTGIYVIGVISKESSAGGSLSYYAMSSSQFEHFKTIFLGDTSWAVGSFSGFEISEELWKSLFNPFQYIASCKWFPISSISGTSETTIKLGWWDLENCPCTKITQLHRDIPNFRFMIPQRSPTSYPFLTLPPHAEYKLFIPPFGEYSLDGYIVGNQYGIQNWGTIIASIRIDLVSGKGTLLVTHTPPNEQHESRHSILVCDTAQIAVDVSFGQINSDIVGAIRTGVGMVESAARGIANLDPGAIIGGTVGGLIDAVQAFTPSAQFRGGEGSISIYQTIPFKLYAYYKKITDYDTSDFGGIVYAAERIDTHSGYILTENAHLEISGALHEEISEIESAMNGGFFYE